MDSDSDRSLEDFRDSKDFTEQTKPLPAKRGGVKRQAAECAGKNGRLVRSFKEFGQQGLSGKERRKVKRFSSSMIQKKLAEEKEVYSQEIASSSLRSEREFSRCPMCGQEFGILEIIQHASACLQENFEACKAGHDHIKAGFQRPKLKEVLGSNCDPSLPDKPFSAILCDSDSLERSVEQRNGHTDSGIVYFTKNMSNKQGHTKSEKKLRQTVSCPFCLMALTSRGLKRHLTACQKKHRFTTMSAMALNCPEMEDVDDSLLAEIRKCEEKASVSTIRKKHFKGKRKGCKKSTETYYNETMKLALALSSGENSQECASMKKKKDIDFPVMLTLSPNSKTQQLKNRMHNIAHSEHSLVSEDIPNTPVLPASSLLLSNVGFISNLQVNRGLEEDTMPCTSPEVSSCNMKNRVSSESPAVGGLETVDTPHQLIEEARLSNTRFFVQKSMCFPPRPAKWNFGKSSTESELYHVPGLLSQFDERKKNILQALTEPDDEMNSTLLALRTLDNDCEDADKDPIIGDNECGALDTSGVSGHSLPREKRPVLSQSAAPFVKLIGNSQLSDARMSVGQREEIIYFCENIRS